MEGDYSLTRAATLSFVFRVNFNSSELSNGTVLYRSLSFPAHDAQRRIPVAWLSQSQRPNCPVSPPSQKLTRAFN